METTFPNMKICMNKLVGQSICWLVGHNNMKTTFPEMKICLKINEKRELTLSKLNNQLLVYLVFL